MARTLILLLMAALAAAPASAAVTFDWAYVGNAGNAPDRSGYNDAVSTLGLGAVSYDYMIAKHEVTNAQYAGFLNAVAATDNFSLYSTRMGIGIGGGITRSGAPGSYTYATKPNMANKPVTYVSFFDAMRFTNWLHNGQGNGGTESGAYTIDNGVNEVRSGDSRYWIPSEREWYKAAYHDATAGTAGVYYVYATGSDSVPVSDQPGDNPAAVNYYDNDGLANGFNDGYAVSGANSYGTNPFTDVGAYTAAVSPYGTFDQNGSVWEWNETVIRTFNRGLRGGSWSDSSQFLWAGFRHSYSPTREFSVIGFRVATLVPEPSTLLMASLLSAGLLAPRRA